MKISRVILKVAGPCLLNCFGAGAALADAPAAILFAGPDANAAGLAECIPLTLDVTRPLPFRVGDEAQAGGVRVALGDVTGDGKADIITGSGPGGGGRLRIFNGITHTKLFDTIVPGAGFAAGVEVAAGDVNGDGKSDVIVGAGSGPDPAVKVFNGTNFSPMADINVVDATFVVANGVRVAAGDLDGDGKADIIAGTGRGGPARVKVFRGTDFSPWHAFSPYPSQFIGGVHVGSGNFDGTGSGDIAVVPDFSADSQPIKFFHGQSLSEIASYPLPAPPFISTPFAVHDFDNDGFGDLSIVMKYMIYNMSGKDGGLQITLPHGRPIASGIPSIAVGLVDRDTKPDLVIGCSEFPLVQTITPDFAQDIFGKFPQGPVFAGGIRVAAGDVNGDGVFDMVMGAGNGGGGNVAVCTGVGGGLLDFFSAFTPPAVFPIFVAAGDVNGDNKDDIIVASGQGGPPQVKVFSGSDRALLHSFFAFDPTFTGGVSVASGDIDNDGLADIITGSGPGAVSQVKVFKAGSLAVLRNFAPEVPSFTGGVYVAAGDLNGDGVPDIITGTGIGGATVRVFSGVTSAVIGAFTPYGPGFPGGVRVAVGDADGDGDVDVICAPGPGRAPSVRGFEFPGFARVLTAQPYDSSFTSGVFVSSWTPAPAAVNLTGARSNAAGALALDIAAPKGRTSYLDCTENFLDWQQIQSAAGTGNPITFTVPIVPGASRLYRARSQ